MKKIFLATALALLAILSGSAEVVKTLLLSHDETKIERDDIIQIPGIGLGLYYSADSIMLLDDPSLGFIELIEPIPARSFVALNQGLYAASGDSIYRVATDSLSRQFVGRFDNEQFTLSRASDDSFFVLTADDEFSCVYQVYPDSADCEPVIGIDGPIYKIENNGVATVMWAADCIYTLEDDFSMRPVYQGDAINDAVMTAIGLLVATDEGIHWLPAPDREGMLFSQPVQALWWDPADALYYLTADGDLYRITGLHSEYLAN